VSRRVPYERGLHELGDGLYAYLQPDGSWGLSNAGLITTPGSALLVDTLYDLRLTAAMLEAMRPVLAASPIGAAFNTHSDPDHCFGNQLLPAAIPIHASAAAAAAMEHATPARVRRMLGAVELGAEFAAWARERFGAFEFDGIEQRLPSDTFAGRAEVRVGDRAVELIEVGPAHSAGDAIAHVPDAATVYAGDIVFSGGTPIVWAGPASNWLAACELIVGLQAQTIVPGHGPPTDAAGVRAVARYLDHVRQQARLRFDAGMSVEQAADDIELGEFADLGERERIVVNVEAFYCEFDPGRVMPPVPELFASMARWAARH
jgi:cyclase